MSTEVTVEELKAKMAEYYGKIRDAEIADARERYNENYIERDWSNLLLIHKTAPYNPACDVCRCLMELKQTK